MDDLPIRPGVVIPAAELTVHFARSGGPGGQHGNKTSTKAVVRWSPQSCELLTPIQRARFIRQFGHRLTQTGELILMSELTRSQRQNLNDCRDRLRSMIEYALQTPKSRRATQPTKGSRIRRRRAKEQLSQKKQGRTGPSAHD